MEKRQIQDFAKSYSIETTVKEARRVERFPDIVPKGTAIYIAHVPGTDLQETVDLAKRLRQEGMEPVPHVVARRIESMEQQEKFL